MAHGPQDSGGQIDRLGGDGKDTAHDTSIQNRRYVGNADQLDGQDERGCRYPGAAQQLVVIRGDKQSNEDDAHHVDKNHPVRNEFGGMAHGKAWVLRFSAHDTDENLIADSPSREESCVPKTLGKMSSK